MYVKNLSTTIIHTKNKKYHTATLDLLLSLYLLKQQYQKNRSHSVQQASLFNFKNLLPVGNTDG